MSDKHYTYLKVIYRNYLESRILAGIQDVSSSLGIPLAGASLTQERDLWLPLWPLSLTELNMSLTKAQVSDAQCYRTRLTSVEGG